jgi:hypothetical protein
MREFQFFESIIEKKLLGLIFFPFPENVAQMLVDTRKMH